MSRPRKPFGSTLPGRLPATMIKVLAAEMSDPQRLRRGKQYARDGSVLDIEIEPGIVTCEVQGSRPTPYVAALEVRPGDGMPLRRDVTAHCTCPDDENFDGHACKHVIATMVVFGDELLLEPELLDVWRGRAPDQPRERAIAGSAANDNPSATRRTDRDHGSSSGSERPLRRRRHLTLVADASGDERTERLAVAVEQVEEQRRDTLAHLLAPPAGASLPSLPPLDPIDPPSPPRPELAAVLRDALGHVRVEWD